MVIEHTISACDCGLYDKAILVVSAPYVQEMREVLDACDIMMPIEVVPGGSSRMESCANGVAVICDEEAFVVIHNGVQPFIAKEDFDKSLKALSEYPAVTSGLPCTYTVLETDGSGVLRNIPLRANCYSDLGPECFRLTLLRKVLGILKEENAGYTNLTGVVLKNKLGDVLVLHGSPENFKITYRDDVLRAEHLMHNRK